VRLTEIVEPPASYQRPRGFNLIPHLLSKADSGKNKQNNQLSYYSALKQEMNRYILFF